MGGAGCEWEEQDVSGRSRMCVGGAGCEWGEQDVSGRSRM